MPQVSGNFRLPSQKEQLAAIGLSSDGRQQLLDVDQYDRPIQSKQRVLQALRCCFDPAGGEWEDLEEPRPSEWLDCQNTPDQTFRAYVASRPHRPTRSQNTIYLQPICEAGENEGPPFPAGPWPSWQVLETAVAVFFAPMKVATLPAIAMQRLQPCPDSRDGPYGKQWHAAHVLDAIIRQGLPKDAYGVMAVTMCDLYPRPEWNFVYGLSRLKQRVGVFSFVRHTPKGRSRSPEYRGAQLLRRALKTLIHEIGHMFGLKHCTWYNCLMRGSNGGGVEHQMTHLHLCPVCLRKLHWNIGFDIPTQYARFLDLLKVYAAIHPGFLRDCDFLQRRLEALRDVPPQVTLISDLIPKTSSTGSAERRSSGSGRSTLPKARSKSFSVMEAAPKAQSKSVYPMRAQTPTRSPTPPGPKSENSLVNSSSMPALPRYTSRDVGGVPQPGVQENPNRIAPKAMAVFSRNGGIVVNVMPKNRGSGVRSQSQSVTGPISVFKNLGQPTCDCCATDEILCSSCTD